MNRKVLALVGVAAVVAGVYLYLRQKKAAAAANTVTEATAPSGTPPIGL